MNTMNEDIRSAVELLKRNNYFVIKITNSMLNDMSECARFGEEGVDKNCSECSCNMCVINV